MTEIEPEKKPTIMVFSRIYLLNDFAKMLAPLKYNFNFVHLTDKKTDEVPSLSAKFYQYYRNNDRFPSLTRDVVEEIIVRCRLLRNLAPDRAERLLHAMSLSARDMIDSVKPDAIFSQVTDDYVSHVLAIVATMKDIPVTQYCQSYFPDRAYITDFTYGNPVNVTEPDVAAAKAMVSTIGDSKYRQNYANLKTYGRLKHVQRVLRYMVKRLVFATKGAIENDRLYLHYIITPFIAERKSLLDYPSPSLFDSNWKERLEQLQAKGNVQTIYLPLAYTPESTIDYWIAKRSVIAYEDFTLKAVRALSKSPNVVLLVKDHFHMLGMRRPRFYSALRANKQVILVPPAEYSNVVLAHSDCIVLGAGSAGPEATVLQKPIATYSNTSYWYGPSCATYLDPDDLESWPRLIDKAIDENVEMTTAVIENAVAQMMASTIPLVDKGQIWPLAEPAALAAVLRQSLHRPRPKSLLHQPAS
jgi:hypothetical protein